MILPKRRFYFSVLAALMLSCSAADHVAGQTAAVLKTAPDAATPITSLKIQIADPDKNKSDTTLVPVTFGQVFAPGDVPDPAALTGSLADGTPVALQVDAKARHSDGSLRHAVLTAAVPLSLAGEVTTLALNRAQTAVTRANGTGPAELLKSGFTARVNITLNGQLYTVSADELLRAGKPAVWLSGPLVNEWQVWSAFKTAQGVVHPNLSARFAIRSYTGTGAGSVDVVIENDWAYAPGPQNYTYDVQVLVGGKPVYSKTQLTHYHHARWRKVFNWGTRPETQIRHDTAYLISSRAVPNYDRPLRTSAPLMSVSSVHLPGDKVESKGENKAENKFEPMGSGLAMAYMPSTGGRGDIGLLPGWAVSYLLSMNSGAKKAMLATADLSGSWSMHYRNQITNRPVSIVDYPYMSLVGNPGDTLNPKTRKLEVFPVCGGDCKTPLTADSAHEPAMSYLPYLVTGDYYYLEELQFWAMYDLLQSNPGYRENSKGLFHRTQVRAQAWILRDLASVAYITPDADVLKKQFENFLSTNLDWYNATYSFNSSADNTFGALTDIDARQYRNYTAIAPWQDDFFTSAVGYTVELGFEKALPLLKWKAKFPIKRMTDPGYCWIFGAAYEFHVTDRNGAPMYKDMAQSYRASNPENVTSLPCGSLAMANALKLRVGEMTGYADSPGGFPSNMQPALAYAAKVDVPGGAQAWKVFMARSVKPDYSQSSQYAIVPRTK